MLDRRRFSRVSVALRIELRHESWEPAVAIDLSSRGMFVRTVHPSPPRRLVRIRVLNPIDRSTLELMGTVSREERPWTALSTGRLPGMALEFFRPSREAIEALEQMIASLTRLADTPLELGTGFSS